MPDSDYEDKTITCGCGTDFVWEAGEQRFYAERGFSPPKRCPKCRKARKVQQSEIDEFAEVWKEGARGNRKRRRR